ncbi:MAG: hypothetical protein WA884_15540 [Methyloceanibacter sp.]
MASDIYEELFERMKAGRDALADKYPWFTHDTALGQLQGIRKEGLLPHAVSSCPSEVINWFGEPGRQIVCLHPVGAALRPHSSKYGRLIRLAVSGADLPDRVGLDWSYDWNLARCIRKDSPDKSCNDILLDVARRRGSVAAYDGIPASKLRIWREGLPHDPAQWPKLDEITDAEAKTF